MSSRSCPAIVALVLISVFVWVYETSEGIEREWMRELMAPEVDLGVVTPDELDALAGSRSTLKTYIRSQPSRRTAKRVLEAETDLAHQIARDVVPRLPRLSGLARRWRRRASPKAFG